MSVLHTVWSPRDTLHVWAERPLTGDRLPKPRGRAPADGGPRPHPYALRTEELRAAVAAVTGLDTGDLATTETVLVLPSGVHAPLPSPDLPGASGIGAEPGEPRPRRADAIELSADTLIDTALALPAGPDGAPGVDASLSSVAGIVLVALDLVARGRVLPGLTQRGGRWEARWQPVVGAAERQHLMRLATELPPALLAAAGEERRSPGTIVREAVEQITDTAARSALESTRLTKPRRSRKPPGVEEAWLTALTSADPRPDADRDDLSVLAKDLDGWHRSAPTDGALRTSFRLVPPGGAAAGPSLAGEPDAAHEPDTAGADIDPGTGDSAHARTWQLEFLLQSTDDPSLLVPAGEVWRSGETLAFLERTLEAPQERLLADLGRVTRLWPELADALGTARPEQLDLDVNEVIGFLRDTAPLLEQAGFGVLLPAELRRPGRLGARLQTRSAASSGESSGLLGHDAIVDYRWQVAVGDDDPLTAAELRELAGLKASLVRVRGRWVELREDDVQTALDLLDRSDDERSHDGQMSVAEAARIGLGATDPGIGLPVAGVDADGPLGALLSGDADARLEPLDTPEGFEGTLRPYQARGVAWLAFLASVGLGGCLADDMGLGKTPQLLALLAHERAGRTRRTGRRKVASSRRWPNPTLLVCPMSIVGNWEREAARFAPGVRVHIHHGRDRLADEALPGELAAADLVITTYATAARDAELLAGVEWGRIALDEAQHIKNPQARTSRAIRSLPAPQRIALTGTPVENRLAELWSVMDFCNPGLLGPPKAFRSRFALPIERFRDEQAAATLRTLTRPFLLRRVKTDRAIVTDLPDKLEIDERCTLTREQASLYQAVVDDMLAKIEQSEGIERKGLVLTTMLRLKQVCNHPAHLLGDGSRLEGRSGKLTRLEELVDEIGDAGERVLVFTQFAAFGARIQEHLRDHLGCDVAFLSGATSRTARERMVAAFQADHGPDVLVLSLKAGGVGLNLTAANHVVHYDRWWNPAVEDQATDRAFRIGQRQDVVVRRFTCAGTLEERIAELIASKRDLADRVVGAGESWLTELSTAELREVIALGADAVAE